MNYVTRNVILCVVVLTVCLASIFPMDKNLRLGKDLAGGVNLVYTVDVKPDDSRDVVERTIAVLRDRVNPDGLFEISMVQQGRDRVEISMPLPNERVRTLRAKYDQALTSFGDYALEPDGFLSAMRLTGPARVEALSRLGDTPGRAALLAPVREAAERADAARLAFEAAKAQGTIDAELAPLLEAAGDAEAQLEIAREKVLDSLVSTDVLRAAMDLSDKSHRLQDKKSKETVVVPSPRERALSEIEGKIKDLPGATDVMKNVRQAHADFAAQRIGFDDPADLIRMLKGAGVLNFRVTVRPGALPDEARVRRELRERGPANVKVDGAGWFRLNAIDNWFTKPAELRAVRDDAPGYFSSRYGAVVEEYGGQYYMLLLDVPGKRLTSAEGAWALTRSAPSVDELGRPSVSFQMDPRGAVLMGEMTQNNIQQQMAMVLDDQVYSTATIQGRIASSGQISGNFSPDTIGYLVKTLNAGSLSAKLGDRPISQSVMAPELGADNLTRALDAAWICFIAVGVFMLVYYFFSGAIAMIALTVNTIIVLGVMSLNRAAFTLPGIAGVVLIFGTAVDANVLIYERIREELTAGRDIRTAVRIAFKRAATVIIDANMTHLIVALVLAGAIPFVDPPAEIKGFGISLGIGVVATLFSTMIVTRLIYVVLVDRMKLGAWVVNQLPVAVPSIQRVLTPKIDWMKLFPILSPLSFVMIGVGLFFVFQQGSNLLDSEFRGGTSITIQLKEAEDGTGERLTLKRNEVERRVHELADKAGATPGSPLSELRNAEVLAINPKGDGVTSDMFTIRTTLTDEKAVRTAVVDAFGDVVLSRAPTRFKGSDVTDSAAAPAFAVVDEKLGASIGRPDVVNDVTRYLGGLVVVLENLDPPPTREALSARLDYVRASPAYSGTALRRDHSVIVLEGTEQAVKSAAVVVRDSSLSAFEDEAKWRASVVTQEWELVREALTTAQIVATIDSFEPAVAATFRAQAIVAIVLCFVLITIYVWVRFGSFRFSLAAVRPLVFDALISIGMVALAEVMYENIPGAAQIGIRPIKIDLGVVAAIMTIIGYSINDTVVILDRIRENRGKRAYVSKQVINDSINQTVSRTVVTAGTALVSLFVLFFVGGEGIASFAYVMLCGMIAGTYSTIAISAPMVYTKHVPPASPEGGEGVRADDDLPALPSSAHV